MGEIKTPWEHLERASPQPWKAGTGIREGFAEEAVSYLEHEGYVALRTKNVQGHIPRPKGKQKQLNL